MTYSFGNDRLKITVDTLGAELVSVLFDGKERLWQNNSGVGWAGHAPILFPFGGHVRMTVDGKDYPCPAHGVAMRSEFSLVEKTQNSAAFVLLSNEETKNCYPFDFKLFVKYTVAANRLKIVYELENIGKKELPFAFGSHESYALQGEVDEYEAVFEQDEVFDAWIHTVEGGVMTGEKRAFGQGKRFAFPKEFMQDYTVIFKGVSSREVLLQKRTGEKVAKLTFPEFENILFWHEADSKMVCMEPWNNLPDAEAEPPRVFADKAVVKRLKAGEKRAYLHEIEYF